MELRKRVQVNIAIVDSHLPTESCRVQPQVAMCELHAFGTRGCATRVVNGRCRIFIRSPGLGFNTKAHQNLVGLGTDDEFVFALN